MTTQAIAIEEPVYQVEKAWEAEQIEIRAYAPRIMAVTGMNEDSDSGFRVLAGYIFGDNAEEQKIAMTAPVMTSFYSSKNKEQEISFVMPKKHNLDTLPAPTRDDVIIKEKELGLVAALSFGGWATEERAKKYIKKLIWKKLKQIKKYQN